MSTESEPLLRNEGGSNQCRSEFARFKRGKFTLLEKVMFTIAITFFVLLCVITSLYTNHDHERRPKKPSHTVPAPPGSNDSTPVCIKPECVLTAAQILQDIDTTLDPCDDFYQFTCNNWIRSHEIPEGKSAINSFSSLATQNKEALRNILSGSFDDFYKQVHQSPSLLPEPEKLIDKQNFEKTKALYESCMDESLIDERGVKPLIPLLKEVRDMLPASRASADEAVNARQLSQVLSYLARKGVGALFEIMVDADPKNPEINSLQLYQSGLTLPNKAYYKQKDTVETLQHTIAEILNVVFKHLQQGLSGNEGANKDIIGNDLGFDADATARVIVDFERSLAEISQLPEELQNPEEIYNPMTLSSLAKLVPSVDWDLYVHHLLPSNSAKHPSQIVVTSPDYIAKVSKLVGTETSTRTLQAYLAWRVMFAFGDALGEDIRGPIRRLNSKITGTNPKSVKPRWDTCLDEVNEDIGFLAGRYYVLNKFGGNAKEKADEFVNSIKEVFLARLPKLEWIDDETREKAVQKVDELVRKVGYSDVTPDIMSPVSLSDYYADLEIQNDTYFENYIKARTFAVEEEWRQVGKKPDRSKWLMNPQEVNAYYNPSFNEIVFPAGILQNPFFGSNYPDYLNYGGIGVVVGHELTHGFDNMGRHFDAKGRLVQWWTNETAAQFDEKAECFVKQYSNFTMVDVNGEAIHVNGRLTLGENLADNGGLGEAFVAWKERYDSDKESKRYNNVRLPGLDQLSPEKLFFVNFGRVWCNKVTPAQAKKGVLTDEHSPGKWRVNGAVQNSNHFAKVFNCPVGSPMNPTHKCELW